MRHVLALVLALAAFMACMGCDRGPDQVQTRSSLRADQFDLATVVGLVQSNQAANAQALQDRINDPSSGINNVDVDGDGVTDMVMVRETQNGANRTFDFVAVPATRPNDTVVVATANFTPSNGGWDVQAGYPNYVYGYHDHYYSHHLAHDVALATWLYGYHPPFVPVYSMYHYPVHRVYAAPYLTTVRRSYTTSVRVAPIASAPRPAAFASSPTYRVPSRFQNTIRPVSVGSGLSARSGSVPRFAPSAPNVNSTAGTGFWNNRAPMRSPTVTAAPAYRPSPGPSVTRSTGLFGGGRSSGGLGGFSRSSGGFGGGRTSGGFGRR